MPSLVAYYLGTEDVNAIPWWERANKAVVFGFMATLGFVTLFAVVGVVFAASGRAFGAVFPASGLAIGVGLVLLGAWLLMTGRTLGLADASRAMGGIQLRTGMRALFLFGIAYGVASLACTLPVFLVVVGTTLTTAGFINASAQFVAYGLGMGTMLTIVIVAAAFFRSAITASLKSVVPHVHRFAASLLLGAGIFIVYYWLVPGGLLP